MLYRRCLLFSLSYKNAVANKGHDKNQNDWRHKPKFRLIAYNSSMLGNGGLSTPEKRFEIGGNTVLSTEQMRYSHESSYNREKGKNCHRNGHGFWGFMYRVRGMLLF